jgi:hypothetical protein
MKLRLEGTLAECEQAAALLSQTFEVVSASDPYPNRGRSRLVRVYVEVRLGPRPHPDRAYRAVPPTRHAPSRPSGAARPLTSSPMRGILDTRRRRPST